MKKNINLKILCILSLLFVSNCVSSKHEQTRLSDELGYTDKIKNSYSVDKEWWKQYNNAELNSLVDFALKNNSNYLIAALNINKELYRLSLTKTDLFPTANANLRTSSQRDIYTSDNFSNSFSGELGINYELDLYGKIRNAADAQEFEYKATVLDKDSAKLALINSIIDLYFNLSYLKNSIEITENNLAIYENMQKIIQEKYVRGKIDPLSLIQIKQTIFSEKNNLLDLQTQFAETEQSLRNLLNIRPNDTLNLKYPDILDTNVIGVDLNIPLAVLSERPDLKANEYRLRKAFKNLQIEDKNWYPTVSLGGAIGSSSSKARTAFDFSYIMGSVSLDLPFLDWNRVKNNIKISETDYEISLVGFRDSLSTALNEIAYYYTAYNNSLSLFSNTEQRHRYSIEIKQYYEDRYNSGKIEFKDLLDAINTVNSSKAELIRQKYQIINYENNIYKSTAGKYRTI